MYFHSEEIDNFTHTILASDSYQAVPLAVTETMKAGMPVKADGSKSTDGTDAIGILLYDADKDRNPNAAVVVTGIVDWAKCQAINEELTGTDATAISAKLTHIVFRDAAGKTYTGGSEAA